MIKRSLVTTLIGITFAAGVMLAHPPTFEVSFTPSASEMPITGRLILMIAKSDQPESRLSFSLRGPAIAGIDIDQLKPNQTVVIDDNVLAYPGKLSEIPSGDYYVQAVINVYQQVHRSDGKTIWVPMNDGRPEFFNTAAGNLYSDVYPVKFGKGGSMKISVSHVMPEKPHPEDTEWIKHVTVKSQKLTEFWGHPIYIHATVLLPKGYEDHPESYYPSIYTLGHIRGPFFFTTIPPKEEEGRPVVNPVTGLENGYEFYKSWSSDNIPRFIAIALLQQTPYFADSYSVNSANNGPYGDAVVEEVIPFLEDHFRIMRKPYARHLEGASTSGWQSLALILQHPDFFGGAWILQPDPIDFTSYIQSNIYED
jgi:hypothetical protein